MATLGGKALGVTPPLNEAPPTAEEQQASTALIDELKRQNNYENAAETQKRNKVLYSLQAITEEFVRQVGREQGRSEALIKSAGGRVVAFGSYKLGVIGPGSDIDTLVVAPQFVTKDDFFNKFPDLLIKMATEGPIEELTAKPDAFAPCITLKYGGIDIDLLFGRVMHDRVPQNISLLDQDMLRGLSEQEVRSLNGIRVAEEIMNLVPQPGIFRTALRAIKLWGTRRAIAGNIYGFPGGVAWAILVARVCQLYPKATSSVIVHKFFRVLVQWPWPSPVILKTIEQGKLNLRVWNPRLYPSDSYHLMPIITPAYPSMCTTHNFTTSTKEVIMKEFKRAGAITQKVMDGKTQWKDLFVKHTFFTQDYKYYLSIVSASTSKENQMIWSGFVESKVRILVGKLSGHDSINVAHPFNKGFTRVHRCRTTEEVEEVKKGSLLYHAKDIATATTGHGLTLEPLIKGELNEEKRAEEGEGVTLVYTATHYIGLEMYEGAKSLDLGYQVSSFKEMCKLSDAFKEDENSLEVGHIKKYTPRLTSFSSPNIILSCDLPDDVFAEGEVKPTRPSKKTKKRSANEVCDYITELTLTKPKTWICMAEHSEQRYAPSSMEANMLQEQNKQSAKRQQTSVAAAG